MRIILCALAFASFISAQSLPATAPITMQGDFAAQMVEGFARYLLRETQQQIPRRSPTRERLRKALGVVDERTPFHTLELVATLEQPALLARTPLFRVYAVRWPVLPGITAEGLLFEPERQVKARVVVLPDASQIPEDFAVSQTLAASDCQVLSPVLINREDTWSGNPRIRMTNQPHREFIYRMAFVVGRHIWGYEVQKTLAAVDWFAAQQSKAPIGVWGYGEGGAVALFSAALDDRITATVVSGYFEPRETLWQQPLYRNVFGLLKDFGDAELAAMIPPRTLVIDKSPGPAVSGPPEPSPTRRGAAPGRLTPASAAIVEREYERARALSKSGSLVLTSDGIAPFLRALGIQHRGSSSAQLPAGGNPERQHRQFSEMVDYTQKMAAESERGRDALWRKTEGASPEQWEKIAPFYRAKFWDEVIGRLPAPTVPLNVRTQKSYSSAAWDGYEVMYDVYPDVFGYGVLLLPKDIKPGERRPVLVAQHGLNGRPQHMFGQKEMDTNLNFHYYQNIGSRMADLGYVVYMPQNLYVGDDFRKISRLANPLGLSLFSFILAQQDRLLEWLTSLPFVNPARIGFYGLSYGGKTALRVPSLLGRYALSVCSGDFNEWVDKLISVEEQFSYMFTHEYEILEFNLAHVANHAEMAKMIAPRPFMVERGHRDAVGSDQRVAYEYAKVKRFYDEMGIGERTAIEYFNGPHMIHGVGTVEFIRRYLGR